MPRADDKPDFATHSKGREPGHEPLGVVAEALARLRFGAIQLTVHDGKVMQIDVTERRRFGN